VPDAIGTVRDRLPDLKDVRRFLMRERAFKGLAETALK
jgi:hypothetical protein